MANKIPYYIKEITEGTGSKQYILVAGMIIQTEHYKWLDQFLTNIHQIFTDKEKIRENLAQQNKHTGKSQAIWLQN